MATKSISEMKPVLENEIIQLTEELKKTQKRAIKIRKDISQDKKFLATINRQLSHTKEDEN